jgi:hypothetical protein
VNIGSLRWRLDRAGRADAASRLRAVNLRLGELMQSTEHDFLAVGGALDHISAGVRKQLETLQQFSQTPDGGEGKLLSGTLDEAVHWAGSRRQDSGWAGALGELLPLAEAIRSPLLDLGKTTRALRVMGVVARVEAARLGTRAAGFEALAEELGSLAGGVERRADAISEGVADLGAVLRGARSAMERLECRQREDLRRLLAESAAGLNEVRAGHERAAEVSAAASAGYGKVTDGVGEIFTALQFHDSTRQRLEHVQSALALLAAEIGGRRGIEPQVAVRSLELQVAQLHESRRSFLDSVGKVKADLDGLSELARRFAGSARGLSETLEAHARAGALSARGRCEGVAEAIAEWIGSRKDLLGTAARVGESCARISAFTCEIEAVGVRMLWLALNAEVQAVALLESGTVMESVAECIRGVSQQAAANAARVAEGLQRMHAAVAGLTGRLRADGNGTVREAESVEANVRELARRLDAAGAGHTALLTAIAEGGELLATEIADLSGGITADQGMDGAAEECLAALGGVAALARQAAGRRSGEAAPLVSARERYTMHAERAVHDSFAGRTESAPPPAAAGSGSELGGNVELF